ncbi:MAG: M2 family metallopeptidase [Acidobacteriota bacterium]
MKPTFWIRPTLALVALLLLAALPVIADSHEAADGTEEYPATAEGAAAFVDAAEAHIYELANAEARAAWVQSNFITVDTQAIAAAASEKALAARSSYARQAVRFDDLDLPYHVERRLQVIKLGGPIAAPADPAKTEELARIASDLEATYGKGKYCKDDGTCLDLLQMTATLANSRNPEELLDVWVGWRTVAPPMRKPYQRFVELNNQGARELGFADAGAMWRSNYDMEPDAFAGELDRLWTQVQPLYEALHCHVRAKLLEEYGGEHLGTGKTIPAHLLGNMWAQGWANIYPLVAPPDADPGFDLTERLRATGMDAVEMVRSGERFFSSLGFEPLPDTFWERSLFTKPADREVVCHASAWDVDNVNDLRIKMCIEINAEDFRTVHHELGHNYYQRAYNQQPFLYRNSANDGFHEAIGDTIALSVTPDYLQQIGLIDEVPDPSKDLGLLMKDALDKVAFLPFGLLVDQWRWKVFSGEVGPEEYNAAWWELREKYQGVSPPVARSEADFDPGAKYHIPANTPYSRYFLAHILQFQFHRDLCAIAGYEGPLNRCTIYGNEEAGEVLDEMLRMGASRPWPEALQVVTGGREMDATAVLDYFAPLKSWLDEQNASRQCGW